MLTGKDGLVAAPRGAVLPGDRARAARRGMTLIEIAVAVTILAIGMGTAVYTLLGAMALQRSVVERSLALQAAESALESLQATPFPDSFARFNGTVADDPPGVASPGDDFAVPGLTPWPADPDGQPGEFLFPGNNLLLFENVNDPELGMPRDLNGDGDALDAVAPGDHVVVPVRVRVRWTGVMGNRELILGTTVTNERKP